MHSVNRQFIRRAPRAQNNAAPAASPKEEPVDATAVAAIANEIALHVVAEPGAVLDQSHNVSKILSHPALAVGRQIEMLNVFIGFEQANKYVMYDAQNGAPLGYVMEDGQSIGKSLMRQFLGTHRAFTATILDLDGRELLKIHRPFQWINSRLTVLDPEHRVIGEVHQRWHLWRRRYELFTE